MITEQKTGENDIIIRPFPNRAAKMENISDYQYFNSHMNFTKFTEMFKDFDFQSTPRIQKRGSAWVIPKNITKEKQKNKSNKNQKKAGNKVSVDFYIMDLKREKEIELGSSFPNISLNSNECLIHQSVARSLSINQTQILESPDINISINMEPFLMNFLISKYYMNTTHEYNPNITKIIYINYYNIEFPCKVKKILDENFGKLNQEIHSTVIMDYVNFFEYISDYLSK